MGQKWETRPLEAWDKAKALRAKWQKSIDESGSSAGTLLAHGNTGRVDWSIGFHNLQVIEDNPLGAMMASKSAEFSRLCRLASEIRGWGRELCGYVNNCWGSMFLGYQLDGSHFPMRQLSIPFPCVCDQHTKRGQEAMDLEPIPRWGLDRPMYIGRRDAKREDEMTEHVVWCTLKIINDIERIYGRTFDDAKLIESIRVRNLVQGFAFDVSKLMTNIPAPIGQKDLYSFYTMGLLTKVSPEETLDLWKSFRDEIQWRVDHQIAAVGNERYRWMEAHPPAWHYLKYYRYMEQYGAVCIGSQYSHILAGPMKLNGDGTLGEREAVAYPDINEVKTREDIVRVMLGFDVRVPHNMKTDEYTNPHALVDFAKAFKADGAIMPLWRGGVGCTFTRKEQALRLDGAGVRVLHYEGTQPGDQTDMDERLFLNQMDTWMESQGLRKGNTG
jgi:benzoyl-CoA reductase subunit B